MKSVKVARICVASVVVFAFLQISMATNVPPASVSNSVTDHAFPAPPKSQGLTAKDFVPFIASLLGAFFGALGAYWVGRFKEHRDEEKRQHTALLAAQYALFSQWHAVESVRRFLEPNRNHKYRATRLGTYFHCDAEMVPSDDLTFIVDTKDSNLLQEIHLAQMSYNHVVMAVHAYNEAKRKFEAKHPPGNLDLETKMSTIEITKDEYNRMALVVDWLYQQTDEALPKFDPQIRNIHKFVKSHFKGKRKALPGIDQLERVEKTH